MACPRGERSKTGTYKKWRQDFTFPAAGFLSDPLRLFCLEYFLRRTMNNKRQTMDSHCLPFRIISLSTS